MRNDPERETHTTTLLELSRALAAMAEDDERAVQVLSALIRRGCVRNRDGRRFVLAPDAETAPRECPKSLSFSALPAASGAPRTAIDPRGSSE